MDLVAYLGVLRRRWLVIVLCVIAGLCGGYYLGHHGIKTYEASSRALVNIPAAGTVQDQLAGSQLTDNLVQTYAEIATSRAVGAQIANSLGLQESPSSIAGQLSATAVQNTYIINITATDTDPRQAQALASAAATALRTVVANLQPNVSDRISVQVVDYATLPISPVSPKPKLDLILGGILGLVAGLLAAALLEALDRTVKSVTQVDALLRLPLIGLVPRRKGPSLVVATSNTGPESEPYRSMRTAVRFLDPDNPLRSLLITSPTPGDGKTTTAANLALALALSGERVIVVDADLRRADLAEMFGLERAVGLTSLVLGTATLDEALQPSRENLQVLASGPIPPNPSEILSSQLFHRILDDLTKRADIVILDAPPVLPVTDAVALAAQVDGAVVVTRYGATLRHAALEARRRLDAVGAVSVGYVLNAVPASESRGYYADYRYAERSVRQPAAAIGEERPLVSAASPDGAHQALTATGSLRRTPTGGASSAVDGPP